MGSKNSNYQLSLCISIVSHQHGKFLKDLLNDLQPLMKFGVQVILTLNVPENEFFLDSLRYRPEIIRNEFPLGFGKNHNNAFRLTNCKWFSVLNPDIRLDPSVFGRLLSAPPRGMGLVAPAIINKEGEIVDSARHYPTLVRIIKRVTLRMFKLSSSLDYQPNDMNHTKVEWVSGCFMIFDSESFQHVRGFDEKYHMYLEDADICKRLNSANLTVNICYRIKVMHYAQHASQTNLIHLWWHLNSLIRFFSSNLH